MLRSFLIAAVWIVVACDFRSGLVAQEQRPVFRFDPNKTLIFSADANSKSDPFESSDGKMRIAVDFKKIRVLSIANDEVLYEFATPNRAMAPTFSPDQKSVVFADCTGNLACESNFYVHQLENGSQANLGSCIGVTTQVAFSADGKRVAAVSMYGPIMALLPQQEFKKSLIGEIIVFDIATKSEMLHMAYEIPNPESAARKAKPPVLDQIALDYDGTTLLVTADSGVVKVIDVVAGAEKISVATKAAELSSGKKGNQN